MNIKRLARDPRAIRAVLGMSYNEFVQLVPIFNEALLAIQRERPNRQRAIGGGQKGKLPTTEDKLFFILFYIKTYPTFDVLGYVFDKDRGRSCTAAHGYLAALERGLGKTIQFPKRKIHSVEEFLEAFPEVKDVLLDGTERRIQRPKNAKRNKRQYSGKKKSHTRKNIIMADAQKRILLVSPTKPGRRHDKRLADRISLVEHIPKDIGIWADSGFQGIHHKHSHTLVAKRGRKNRPLTDEEKAENHVISSFRVRVEHAIGGMKRFRAYSDVLRNKIGRFDDRIAVVTAGLWNYHLAHT
jgi:hypothetical protein